ncbi:hypothetical protein C8R46DRAFT_1345929 [Mycena filopes]|nr:hypothetical protein C8R46DRAFT_1345929 [Mycena filopes]
MFSPLLYLSLFFTAANAAAPTYSATYLPSNVPDKTEEGQTGTNRCGTALNQTSNCQDAYLNSLEDWCLWAPPEPGPGSTIGETERIEVAWCLKNGTGARLIPDGAIMGAHWLITPDYIQVTGTGNLTLLNIPAKDEGGELDPHGADGNGNPIGGIVWSTAFGGQLEQIFEWTNFMSDSEFCFRACDPKGSNAPGYCQHIYDEVGCMWNMPGNYEKGFDSCSADSGEPPGVYGGSTFHQGDPATPAPHPAPSPKSCTTVTSIGNGFLIQGTSIGLPSTPATPTGNGASSGASGTSGGASGASRGASGASSGGAKPTGSNNSACRRGPGVTSVQGWERITMSLGSAIVFSLVGALIVL